MTTAIDVLQPAADYQIGRAYGFYIDAADVRPHCRLDDILRHGICNEGDRAFLRGFHSARNERRRLLDQAQSGPVGDAGPVADGDALS
jgi:hypothetical protein